MVRDSGESIVIVTAVLRSRHALQSRRVGIVVHYASFELKNLSAVMHCSPVDVHGRSANLPVHRATMSFKIPCIAVVTHSRIILSCSVKKAICDLGPVVCY